MTITLQQFINALAEKYEDFTVGYQEQPTGEDVKDLYEDFLESGKTFEEYSKEEDC